MYTAIVHISAYMHKMKQHNMEMDQNVPLHELNDAGINNVIKTVSGETKEECMTKLKLLMEKLDSGAKIAEPSIPKDKTKEKKEK